MTEAWIATFALMLLRLATFWMFLPVWNVQKPPRSVKLGLILALTVFWMGQLQQPASALVIWAEQPDNWLPLLFLAGREVALGGLLSLAFYLFVIPAQIAGAWIGQELGLSMSTLTDPSSGAPVNIVSVTFQAIAMVLFFSLDLHHFIIQALHFSFESVPVGNPWNFGPMMSTSHELQSVTRAGLEIIGPAGIVMFVTLMALLVLARAAPSLNLFSVGISVRLVAGLAALAIFLPQLLGKIALGFQHCQDFILDLIRQIGAVG